MLAYPRVLPRCGTSFMAVNRVPHGGPVDAFCRVLAAFCGFHRGKERVRPPKCQTAPVKDGLRGCCNPS